MKRILLFVLILMLSVPLLVYSQEGNQSQLVSEEKQNEERERAEKMEIEVVSNLVKSFGSKLQFVSLLAPKEILEKSMQENYGEFVSKALLKKWIDDPLNAPGRLTSSPWPDRIEIQTIKKISQNEYEVKGTIIEITSTEKEDNGAFIKRQITLIVKKINNRWLIDDVILGKYVEYGANMHNITNALLKGY